MLNKILIQKYKPKLVVIGTSFLDYTEVREYQIDERFRQNEWLKYQTGQFTISGWLTEHSYAWRAITLFSYSAPYGLRMDEVLREAHKWDGEIAESGFALSEKAVNPNLPVDTGFVKNLQSEFGNFGVSERNLSALEETISHPATVTESGRSSLVLPRGEYAAATISWNFTFLNRANFWRLARFFDIHRGRARAFFAPVDRNELTVVSLTSSYMDIQPYGVFEDAEKLIKFVALDYEIVKVESITDNTTSWRVTFAKAAVNTSPKRVCRASKFRFDQSSLTEEWRSPEICSVNLNAVEIRRDEVLDVGNLPG